MSAGTYNLKVEQGTTWQLSMTWKIDGDPVDLTGYTARMQVRVSPDSSTTLLDFTTENGHITLGGVDGTIVLDMSDTETAALTWPRGRYDLELVSAGGIVKRLLQGTMLISPEVTR